MTKKLLAILLMAAMLLTVPFAASSAAASLRRGDADGDGKITSGDARLALRASVRLEPLTADFIMRCDADANGKVESSDARTILRTSVNLDSITQSQCDHQVKTWEAVVLPNGDSADYHRGACTKCGEVIFSGHVAGAAATCVKPQVCSKCKTELAAPIGHVYKETAAITLTKGIRCERCGKVGMPGFNELVNTLKDGTHTYTGFKVTSNSAQRPKFTGLMELMINVMPKSEREQMLNEFAATETYYSTLVKDRAITAYDFNLIGEDVVSKLKDGDVKSIAFEWTNGVDFLASLPNSYTNERDKVESLAEIKNAAIGPVAKITLTFAPETNTTNGPISRIDSELSEIISESSGDLGGMASEFNIFGEGSMKMDLKSTATLTVTYYFDAKTSAPIAAHYDDGVTIDSTMNLFIDDATGEITDKSTGSVAMNVATKMDSYYFFDDYFKS